MPSKPLDVDRLIAEVAARHGVLLKRDDVAFALVTLNELVLERNLDEIDARVREAARTFEAAAERLQAGTGGIIARELRSALMEVRDKVQQECRSRREPQRISAGTMVVAVLIFIAGLCVGLVLH